MLARRVDRDQSLVVDAACKKLPRLGDALTSNEEGGPRDDYFMVHLQSAGAELCHLRAIGEHHVK